MPLRSFGCFRAGKAVHNLPWTSQHRNPVSVMVAQRLVVRGAFVLREVAGAVRHASGEIQDFHRSRPQDKPTVRGETSPVALRRRTTGAWRWCR